MRKKIIIFVALSILLSGCSAKGAFEVDKYKDYKCFDYHLACLDAHEQKANTTVWFDDLKYSIWYRKPVGESDEQFICASVRQEHPLSSTEIVVMQNPNGHIDVFSEWTIEKIELYCIDLRNSKPLWDEDEPAITPAKVLNTNTDAVVFDEFINFLTNEGYLDKYILNDNFKRETPNDDYVMYIRVHFNESENIVWDSPVNSYVHKQTQARNIAIDKGRCPEGIAAPSSLMVSIEDFPNLQKFVSGTIDALINMD